MKHARKISPVTGNLTPDVVVSSPRDELGAALNRMVRRLRAVVREAQADSADVSESAAMLRRTSEDGSDGVGRQSNATHQASASVEQMTATTRRSAENAIQTETIARESAEQARRSGGSVRRALTSMNAIAQKLSIIQEIARQTDLLALNAAIAADGRMDRARHAAPVRPRGRMPALPSQPAMIRA